ncbi:MAG: carbohydrate-binding family 9-like protein [Spirochaetia bacterium]
MKYIVRQTDSVPDFTDWFGGAWEKAQIAQIAVFHAESSPRNRPETEVKLLHDSSSIYVFFRVIDPFILGRYTRFNEPVYTDSCVEFFFSPGEGQGYFNVETNCLGTQLMSHVKAGNAVRFSKEEGSSIKAVPIITGPDQQTGKMVWTLGYVLHMELFQKYVSDLIPLSGKEWRGNFYKCGDDLPEPHWASWAPIGPELQFHVPEYFAPVIFE